MSPDELKAALKDASDEVRGLVDKQAGEIKEHGEALTETKSALELAQKQAKELADKLADSETKSADLEKQIQTMDEGLKEIQAKMKKPGFGGDDEKKTAGQLFVESDVFDELKAAGRGTGKPFEIKDITGTTGSAVALVDSDRDPTVYRTIGGRRQIRIADLIPSIPTTSGNVEIMRQDSFTNNAAPQGTVAGQGGGELVAKAESEITWELVNCPIRTIAHWVAASRQVLSDAPMLRGLIDTELNYGLQLESDNQLLLGDGTGQNMTGIMNDAAINDSGSGDGTGAGMIDQIRAAITLCQQNEYYNINGIVLNPVDWEIMETAKATDGHYIRVAFAPTAGDVPVLWRVPVVVTNAMPEDQFLLGDWTMGAQRYTREGVNVRVSESHADYFIRNGVIVLAEYRECLAVSRPKAFTKGDFGRVT